MCQGEELNLKAELFLNYRQLRMVARQKLFKENADEDTIVVDYVIVTYKTYILFDYL